MEDQGFDGALGVVLAETFARAKSECKEIISELWLITVNDLVFLKGYFCNCDYNGAEDQGEYVPLMA